jgi:hypothetical protein
MITGTIRSKGLTPPKAGTFHYQSKDASKYLDNNIYAMRGVVYEEDPIKLQEIMDKTDREREESHRKNKFLR